MKMRNPIASFALAVLVAPPALAELRVVSTTPEYAAIASALAGENAKIASLARPTEDPHFVDAKPSHIVTLNRADVLLEGGADLEAGWLAPLVEGARNPKIALGAPGRVRASEGIALLDVPAVLDRSQGDLHAVGNPHFMMDPENARVVARHIVATLCDLEPGGCDSLRGNLVRFERSLEAKIREWDTILAPYRGVPVVTYHPTWKYFTRRFGLVSDVYLEPKPGIPPSPPHLAKVIEAMTERKIGTILVEPFQSRKTAESVAARTGAVVVNVCQFPGGLPGTDNDYLELMDANVKAVAAALRRGSGGK